MVRPAAEKDDTANPPGYPNTETNDRAVRSRSKKTGSNTTPTTTASDSRKVPISKGYWSDFLLCE